MSNNNDVGLLTDILASLTTGSEMGGTVAHDEVDAGNPVAIGGNAVTSQGVAVAAGDRVRAVFTRKGALHISMGTPVSAGVAGGSQVAFAEGDDSFYPVAVGGYVWDGANLVMAPGSTVGAFVVPKGATSGGLSAARIITGTTGVIKNTPGQLYGLPSVRNANAAVRYLHLYDKASAPTLSTDIPILTIPLLASAIQTGICISDIGVAFTLGIAWSYTTDNASAPATAGTSAELQFVAAYK